MEPTNQNYFRRKNTKQVLDKIRRISRIVLPIYWAFLTYTLLKSGQDIPKISFLNFSGADKIIHIGIFVVLGFLLQFSYPEMSFLRFFIITFLYSIITEILQELMDLGRSMEFLDLMADTVGLLIGYYMLIRIERLKD